MARRTKKTEKKENNNKATKLMAFFTGIIAFMAIVVFLNPKLSQGVLTAGDYFIINLLVSLAIFLYVLLFK